MISGPSLDWQVKVLISGIEGLTRVIYCLHKLNPWLCHPEDEITCLAEFVSFTLLHPLFVWMLVCHLAHAFLQSKSRNEQLSDVSPSLSLVTSCWITEIAVTRNVGLEGTFSCIPKPLSYRGGQQVSHSVTWASLKSSSPDVCSFLLFSCSFAFKLYNIIFL